MALDWIVLRADEESLESITDAPIPLGRPKHLRKLLTETFVGIRWTGNHAIWQRDSVILELDIPNETELVSLHISVHCNDIQKAIRTLAPGFRKLNRRSGWAVFDVATNGRIEFPMTRERSLRSKPKKVVLQPTNIGSLPSTGTVRRVFYISITTSEDVGSILQELDNIAKSEPDISEWAAIEERARLSFPDGTTLQAISFKREHPSVELTAMRTTRAVAELLGTGEFRLIRGNLPAIAGATAWKY